MADKPAHNPADNAADNREDRRPSEISVRVFGIDDADKPFSRTAKAIRISGNGARLCGLDVLLRVGDIVGVQSAAAKARFKVTAVLPNATGNSGQIEAVCVEGGQSIWPAPFEPTAARTSDSSQQTAAVPQIPPANASPSKNERRRFERYKCDLGAIVVGSDGKRLWARCSDVSLGGCYLDTWSPLPVGSTFDLELDGIAMTAAVSTCHPNVGMGVRFVQVSAPEQLRTLIERLRNPAPTFS